MLRNKRRATGRGVQGPEWFTGENRYPGAKQSEFPGTESQGRDEKPRDRTVSIKPTILIFLGLFERWCTDFEL